MSREQDLSKSAPRAAPNVVKGVSMRIGAALAFALMATVAKLADGYPIGQIVFFRSLFALVVLVFWLRGRGENYEAALEHPKASFRTPSARTARSATCCAGSQARAACSLTFSRSPCCRCPM